MVLCTWPQSCVHGHFFVYMASFSCTWPLFRVFRPFFVYNFTFVYTSDFCVHLRTCVYTNSKVQVKVCALLVYTHLGNCVYTKPRCIHMFGLLVCTHLGNCIYAGLWHGYVARSCQRPRRHAKPFAECQRHLPAHFGTSIMA